MNHFQHDSQLCTDEAMLTYSRKDSDSNINEQEQ